MGYDISFNKGAKLKKMNERDTFLDFCKGIAIFLVVLGHVLEKSMHQMNSLYDFIYLFHMPFFFMLSGYLAWRVKRFDFSFFKKKARTLLLPYIVVGLLFTLVNGEYDAFVFNEFHSDNSSFYSYTTRRLLRNI